MGKVIKSLLLFVGIWFGTCFSLFAKCDSLQFSLLTCEPGELVYELFGHTAIRGKNLTTGEDWVYNYGVFDFGAPNFVMRFVKGETDYQLGVVPYYWFEREYRMRGSAVTEQVLALTGYEAWLLDSLLRTNYLPKNRVYRYNYFYDNCTTRARDRIEDALEGLVCYGSMDGDYTFRQWVSRHTQGHPWADFGIGLCLGAEADVPISHRTQMFLPANLMKALSQATLQDGRTLVKNERNIIPSTRPLNENAVLLTPMQVAFLLLLVILVCSLVEWRRGKIWWMIDLVLFALQGIAGCIIAFLFFFSVHPTVGSNYLLAIFNPIPLVCLPWMIIRVRKGEKTLYDVVNVVILTLFIAFLPLIPQKISLVVVPLALNLLIRSVLHLVVAHKKVFPLLNIGK